MEVNNDEKILGYMPSEISLYNTTGIENRIFTMRGVQVMVDRDLAELYQVETKVLNQAVKRNIDRFPTVFRFLLTDAEKDELVTNCDRFKNLVHSSNNPFAFTEQGVAMLSDIKLSNEESIKDLGKKCFAFPKIEDEAIIKNLISNL